ncbi:MAG: PKD domain-containing protein [Bacteroidia bacterium]
MKKLYSFLLVILVIAGALPAQNCTASFTAVQTQNNTIAFTNTSTPANLNSFWTFGDQQTDFSTNPVHVYANPGLYYVCLTVFDSLSGCQDSFCDSVLVTGTSVQCAALFTWFQTSAGTIAFTNTSLPTTAGYTFSWSFGDSQTSSSVSPSHTYSNPGSYIVCLTMFNSSNCQSTYCDTIQVTGNPPPPCQAAFTFTQNGSGLVQFANTSLPGTLGYSFSWTFGNSQSSSAINPSTTYSSTGNYVVCLTMFDSTCQSTVCDTVQVIISGVDELNAVNWSLYPNPANDMLSIQTSAAIRGMQYHILDIAGREVQAGVFSESHINISNLLPGVYFLSVNDENGKVSVQRFVKQ